MNAQSPLRRLALLYCLLHLSKCSVLDSIVPGSCPITPSKEKVYTRVSEYRDVLSIAEGTSAGVIDSMPSFENSLAGHHRHHRGAWATDPPHG